MNKTKKVRCNVKKNKESKLSLLAVLALFGLNAREARAPYKRIAAAVLNDDVAKCKVTFYARCHLTTREANYLLSFYLLRP